MSLRFFKCYLLSEFVWRRTGVPNTQMSNTEQTSCVCMYILWIQFYTIISISNDFYVRYLCLYVSIDDFASLSLSLARAHFNYVYICV